MIGFAMICPYSNIGRHPDYTLAEFTIFPIYRRNHFALDAAKMTLSAYPGCWEMKYHERNIGGQKNFGTL
ncbi:MAG: hypothetical protein HFE73_00950 [Firmicutes bacterium]|nr:hypothetical protein [Bacillota bacterium]